MRGVGENGMASMATRVGAVVFVFALVVAACSPAGDTTNNTDTAAGQTADVTDGSGQTGGSASCDASGTPTDQDLPSIPILYVSDPIVTPGDTVTVTADAPRNGTVAMGLGDEIIATAPMTGGEATLVVPAGTAPGSYLLELSDDPEGVANGFIRVVDGPAL